MSTVEELLMRRGVQVIAVQEVPARKTPFLDLLRQAKSRCVIAPIGYGNPQNPKPFSAIRLELAEARGWVEVAAAAHPAHWLEFAVISAMIAAAEYTESAYWMVRFSELATTLLVQLIRKLHDETRDAA